AVSCSRGRLIIPTLEVAMVRRVLMTAVAVSLALGFAVPALAQQSRPRIAVVNFENNSTWTYWGDNLGRAAADELVTQLLNGGQFTVIERTQLESVIAEQKLGASGAVDASTAARIGKILGVQFILTGSITQFSIER